MLTNKWPYILAAAAFWIGATGNVLNAIILMMEFIAIAIALYILAYVLLIGIGVYLIWKYAE